MEAGVSYASEESVLWETYQSEILCAVQDSGVVDLSGHGGQEEEKRGGALSWRAGKGGVGSRGRS